MLKYIIADFGRLEEGRIRHFVDVALYVEVSSVTLTFFLEVLYSFASLPFLPAVVAALIKQTDVDGKLGWISSVGSKQARAYILNTSITIGRKLLGSGFDC